MTKDEARKEGLKKRGELSLEIRQEYSEIISKTFFELPAYGKAKRIFLYYSFRDEADTSKMIERIIEEKGFVFLPKVEDKTRMAFYRVFDMEKLKKSSFGIYEPEGEGEGETDPDLFVIPLAAFSKDLCRAGYGGGYYDRYLKDYKGRVPVIGLAFSVQCVPVFETDEHDIKPDMIITEKGLFKSDG